MIEKHLKYAETERGFRAYRFIDRYKEECSLQESSLATEPAIWFGIDVKKTDYDGAPMPKHTLARMHLTKEMVKELLPILEAWVRDEELPKGDL